MTNTHPYKTKAYDQAFDLVSQHTAMETKAQLIMAADIATALQAAYDAGKASNEG